jgi:acyl-CoA reductase-like NAD-dependent aldehyde dehydrogenase/nicotinamidase-related amidase
VSDPEQGASLVLVDLQNDFLARPGLLPDADSLVARAAALLAAFRSAGLTVVHARTLTRPDGSDRMPHWRERGVFECVEGTRGAEPPPVLASDEGELVLRKPRFSAFGDARLEPWLRAHGVRRLVLAGVYLHGCVRSTALDAYERGFEVWVADDAVGTTDPVHGEATRAWLDERAARFASMAEILSDLGLGGSRPRHTGPRPLPVAVIRGARRSAAAHGRLLHRNPCRTAEVLAEVPLGASEDVADAVRSAGDAGRAWARADAVERAELLERWASLLEAERAAWTDRLVREIGKPRRFAEEEAGRAAAHARVAAELARSAGSVAIAPGVRAVARPVGVIALLTPWNNPLAIPVGKLAPALAFGNGVVLKPAPQASETALALVESLGRCGLPAGVVNAVLGGAETARALCRTPGVGAVSLTGSLGSGRVVAALCAESLRPLQAELGGNNAAIVLEDAELDAVVPELVRAAYGFAGQRCTAVRRFVVQRAVASRFQALAVEAIRMLRVGDPDDPETDVGPLISAEKRDAVLAEIERARAEGARRVAGGGVPAALRRGAWLEPTLLGDVDPQSRIAQEESFGPVALIQAADDLEHALALAGGVRQGLLLAACTRDARARARILEAAQAGIVQLGAGPLAVHPRAPFSGWKASGLGPPEHGTWDAAFYARTQALYGDG